MNVIWPERIALPAWLVAGALAAALGAAVVLAPILAVAVVAAGIAALVLARAGVSLTAASLGFVVLGHLVSGQLYVLGLLPEAFAALLDAITAGLFVAVALRPRPRAPRSHIVTVAFLALSALAALNPLLPSLDYAAFGLRQLVLPLVALLVAKEAELSPRDIRFVLLTLALGWAVNVGIALRQWLFAFSGAETAWIEDQDATYLVGDQIRLMGATQSNQDFAFLAAVAVPAVTAYFFSARGGAARVLLGIFVLLSLAVLFGSLIRSTLVGGVIGAIVAAVLASQAAEDRGRVIGYGIAVVGAFLALSLLAPGAMLPENKADTLSTRVTSILDPASDPSLRQRGAEVWPRMFEIIREHPLGGGPGSAGPLSQARAGEAPFGAVVPDNGYLLMAVQLGVVGAIAFVLMLAAWLRDLLSRAVRGIAASAAALGAVVSLMVAMIAGSYWSLVGPSVAMGVVVGLGLRGDGRRGPLDAPREGPRTSHLATRADRLQVPSRPAPVVSGRALGAAAPQRQHRLLIVASPMISAGGVYTYLQRMLPVLDRLGWQTGLLWSARAEVEPPPARWARRMNELGSMFERRKALVGEVRAAVDEWRPDVVLSVLPQSDVACASARLDVPWIAMLHGSPFPRKGEMALVRRVAWQGAVAVAYRRADRVMAVSSSLAADAEAALGLGDVLVVGSGIEVPAEPVARPSREPMLGFLGRLSPEKEPELFIQIAQRLGCRATVFGDGPLAPAIEAAAARDERLTFAGWTDRDTALAQIDLLVVPSQREALGLAVLEAGASGLCAVVRDVGGLGEIFRRDPELARRCVVPSTAGAESWARTIQPLIEHVELREQLGRALHSVVATHYSLEAHASRVAAALRAMTEPARFA